MTYEGNGRVPCPCAIVGKQGERGETKISDKRRAN